MTQVDLDGLTAILRDAARKEILPRFRRLSGSDVRQKTEAIDLVTLADEAAERYIGARLAKSWPDAIVLGEEAVSADAGLLDGMKEMDTAILVDPIDGTANYAAGLPLFGVMAAVVKRGEVVGGVIYDPMGDDCVMAEKGGGAWLVRADGERVRLACAPSLPLNQMVGTASTFFLAEDVRAKVLKNLAQVRMAASYRTAAHEYRTFVTGHLQFIMFQKLMPWDHAAGSLISQEAGGYVARLNGEPYTPEHQTGGILIASDKDSWHQLREQVFTV